MNCINCTRQLLGKALRLVPQWLRAQVDLVPVWQSELHVKQSVWEVKFKLSRTRATTRSVDAFKGHLRVDSFEDLGDSTGASADGS